MVSVYFPANFVLISARNPCSRGHFSASIRECTCTMAAITRYQKRISGPLLDRIGIYIEVPRVEYEKLTSQRQRTWFEGTELLANADMGPAEVREYCCRRAPDQI